jgi:hypothetical protein
MVGKWNVTRKLRIGAPHPALEALSCICIYPFTDINTHLTKDGVYIAAELMTSDPLGRLSVPDVFDFFIAYPNRIIVSRHGWSLSYKHERVKNVDTMNMVFEDDRGRVELTLTKTSVDPGDPMVPDDVYINARVNPTEAKARWMDYRNRYLKDYEENK